MPVKNHDWRLRETCRPMGNWAAGQPSYRRRVGLGCPVKNQQPTTADDDCKSPPLEAWGNLPPSGKLDGRAGALKLRALLLPPVLEREDLEEVAEGEGGGGRGLLEKEMVAVNMPGFHTLVVAEFQPKILVLVAQTASDPVGFSLVG